MRREIAGGVMLALLAPFLAGCGPDWQPSWNMSDQPAAPSDGLTVRRVMGEEPEFQPVRSENIEQLRLTVGALLNSRPTSPEAAMTQVPEYQPVPRPDLDRMVAPPATTEPPPPPRRQGSSTPPPNASVPPPAAVPVRPASAAPVQPEDRERRNGQVVTIPGQPPAVVTGSTGRVQSLVQPGNPAGGVAIQDGGTTTVIQPGGRVTTIPTPR